MPRAFLPCAAFLCFLAVAVSAQDSFHSYTVQPGDTLTRLAWTFNVSAERIQQANQLTSSQLRSGTTLRIPLVTSQPAALPTPEAEVRPAAVDERRALPVPAPPPKEEGTQPVTSDRLVQLARALDAKQLRYGAAWVPPGESTAWEMDCSNTSRYLYRAWAGLEIGRTASDQYLQLSEQRRLYKVGGNLRKVLGKLRPGDLLFWENTYKPVRRPPITHVMIYLGKDRNGQALMFGSQSSRSGGPGIYPFDPERHSGGFSTWFGLVSHKGKFVAYGRPL